MSAGYRSNLTDQSQSDIERAEFAGGIPIFKHGKTRVIAKGADGSPERVAKDGHIRKNAGVVMPHSDKPGKFPQPGKIR